MATRKLLLFFSLAYGISWLIWLPLYAPALRISLPVYPLPLQHALGGLGPLLAALILKGREGKKEWREYGKSLVRPGSIPHFLAAALLPFVLLVLALWAHQWMSGEDVAWTAFWKSAEFPQWSFPLFLAYNLLFF
ncbi:MAG TPA: hypothetical protein VHK69_19420, partial [Chitinophagaceae bacterium]|nr:hypothetical protein [Chitinophagaceae bacterium]